MLRELSVLMDQQLWMSTGNAWLPAESGGSELWSTIRSEVWNVNNYAPRQSATVGCPPVEFQFTMLIYAIYAYAYAYLAIMTISNIRISQSMHIYFKNTFHPNPTWNNGVLDFFTVRSVAERGIAVISCPSVCLSVYDVSGLWSHVLELFENNFTAD